MSEQGPKFEWTGMRQSPEETGKLDKEAAKARELFGERRRKLEELFEGARFEDIAQAHEKAERLITTVPENDRYSAAAHVLQILNDKRPKEILVALQTLEPTPEGRAQTVQDIELVLAFLMITDEFLR